MANEAHLGLTLDQARGEAYARLHLPESASLDQVIKVIGQREQTRQFFNAYTPSDNQEADALYGTTITRGIRNELTRLFETVDESPIEALSVFSEKLRLVEELPLSDEAIAEIDVAIFNVAVDTLSDPASTEIEKAVSVKLSSQFGISQRGDAKAQMILEKRIEAEQAARISHINIESQQAAQSRAQAIDEYLGFFNLSYDAKVIDSTVTANAQKAAAAARESIEKTKQALDDGAKLGQRVAAVTVLASMGVAGGASMAAAETLDSSQAPGSVSTDTVVAQVIPVDSRVPEVTVVAGVEETETPIAATISVSSPAPSIDIEVNGTVNVDDIAALQAGNVPTQTAISTPSIEVIPDVQELSPPAETEKLPVVTVPSNKANQPAQVEVTPSTTPEPLVETSEEVTPAPEPAKIVTPNSDVNVTAGETPQEALTRIIASRDMNAASYAIRKIFGGSGDTEPVNSTLSTLIAANVGTLRVLIGDVNHGDKAYTENGYKALAYLDAVAHNPTLLENPGVAAYVNSLSDQGEDYRNKLFAQYLAEANKALSAETAGSYNNVAEQYRKPIETLYAYATLAGVSDQKQAEQIEAIKAEEARIAEEARLAAEEAERQRLQSESGVEMPGMPTDSEIAIMSAQRIAEMGGEWTNRGLVLKYFLEKGYSHYQACGALGNLMVESGVDPTKHQYGGGRGRGLAQWGASDPALDRFGYDGKRGLVLFAQQQGKPWEDLYVQLDFIMHEFNTTESRAHRAFKATTTVDDAAIVFEDKYERAGTPHMDRRLQGARIMCQTFEDVAQGVRQEVTTQYEAKKQAAEAEIQRKAEEAARLAAAGDIRGELVDGRAMLGALKDKYGKYNSGNLDPSELATTPGYNQRGEPITVSLHPEAMKGYKALAAAFEAHFGRPLYLTDHYRPLAQQIALKNHPDPKKAKLAATPGRSFHGWGTALDVASDVNLYNSETHRWFEQNAHKYGWVNPTWAQDDNKSNGEFEPWHWEFAGNKATYEESNYGR